MKFVEKSGSWAVTVGGRSGTPVLEMPNVTQGNRITVTATFLTKTGGSTDNGFNYKVQATKEADAIAVSNQESIVQGNAGWQTTTKTVIFEARISSQTGVEEVDFEVIFSKGDLDGTGEISNFLMTGAIVSSMD